MEILYKFDVNYETGKPCNCNKNLSALHDVFTNFDQWIIDFKAHIRNNRYLLSPEDIVNRNDLKFSLPRKEDGTQSLDDMEIKIQKRLIFLMRAKKLNFDVNDDYLCDHVLSRLLNDVRKIYLYDYVKCKL